MNGGSSMNKLVGTALGAAVLALLVCPNGARAFSRDSLVWKKCTSCHAPASDGRIPRVEDLRTTPEEWTVIIDRMRRLHHMPLTRAEMVPTTVAMAFGESVQPLTNSAARISAKTQ